MEYQNTSAKIVGGKEMGSMIVYKDRVFESVVCPICPGHARMYPPTGLDAHILARHSVAPPQRKGKGGRTFGKEKPGRRMSSSGVQFHQSIRTIRKKASSMKMILLFVSLFCFAGFAQAQQGPYPLSRTMLNWVWVRGAAPNDGNVSEFRVKCGPTSGQPDQQATIADPNARSIMISKLLTHSGDFYCVITAANINGESGPSNEVHFFVEANPSGPTGLSVSVVP